MALRSSVAGRGIQLAAAATTVYQRARDKGEAARRHRNGKTASPKGRKQTKAQRHRRIECSRKATLCWTGRGTLHASQLERESSWDNFDTTRHQSHRAPHEAYEAGALRQTIAPGLAYTTNPESWPAGSALCRPSECPKPPAENNYAHALHSAYEIRRHHPACVLRRRLVLASPSSRQF